MNCDENINVAYLFVYGTLLSDCKTNPYKNFLNLNTKVFGEAKVKGSLYLVNSYPGLVCDQNDASDVLGELLILNNPMETLKILDDYEGFYADNFQNSEYIRKLKDVFVISNNQFIKAWVYLYNRNVQHLKKIDNGDFLSLMVD